MYGSKNSFRKQGSEWTSFMKHANQWIKLNKKSSLGLHNFSPNRFSKQEYLTLNQAELGDVKERKLVDQTQI